MSRAAQRLRSTGLLVLFLSVSAFTREASAQQTASRPSEAAQPLEVARVRYRQGEEAYKAGRYRESIDFFLDADRLAPSAALSFNIAIAYEKIDDAASALRWYRDYLRRAPDAKDRATVEASVVAMEAALAKKGVAQVTVLSDPPGATLTIDDKPSGVTPWTTETSPGAHRFAFRRDGYQLLEQSVDVPSDHAIDVQVTLVPAVVSSEPAAAPPPPPAAGAPVDNAASPPRAARGATVRTLGIVGLAAGGAALGGALTFELLRRSAESDAKNERTQVGFADRVDTMESRQTVARVLLGTGIVLAATGGVLLFFGHREAAAGDTSVAVGCTPYGCASSVRGRF
jgi:tetratricopeptide (TPR) repeat protein